MTRLEDDVDALSEEQELLLMRSFDEDVSPGEQAEVNELLAGNFAAQELFEQWSEMHKMTEEHIHSMQTSVPSLESKVMARIEQELQLQKIYGQSREVWQQEKSLLDRLRETWKNLVEQFQLAPQFVGAGLALGLVAIGIQMSPSSSPHMNTRINAHMSTMQPVLPASGNSRGSDGNVFAVALHDSLAQRDGTFRDEGNSHMFFEAPGLASSRRSASSGSSGSNFHEVSGSNLASSLGFEQSPIGISFVPKFQTQENVRLASSQAASLQTFQASPSTGALDSGIENIELEWVRSDGRVQIVQGNRSGSPMLFIKRPRQPRETGLLAERSSHGTGIQGAGISALPNAGIFVQTPPSEPAKFSSEGDPNNP